MTPDRPSPEEQESITGVSIYTPEAIERAMAAEKCTTERGTLHFWLILSLGLFLVLAVWLIALYHDSFAALGTLLAGITILGLAVAVLFQNFELRAQRE